MKIALIGEAGGGKDFLAEHLITEYGFTRYAFADEIRKLAAMYFPNQFGDVQNKNRSLLQAIGTKMREIDEDVWINTVINQIQKDILMRSKFNYSLGLFVVTDCRMPNEHLALKKEGFIFIRIKSDDKVRKQRLIDRGDKFLESDLAHHSESFLANFEYDYELSNNSSKEDAIAELNKIMKAIVDLSYIKITEQREINE